VLGGIEPSSEVLKFMLATTTMPSLGEIPMSIFVRFRKLDGRLRMSVAEIKRVSGKIQQRHIIGLGSIALPRTKTVPIEARVGFWRGLEEILDTAGDRIDRATRAKISPYESPGPRAIAACRSSRARCCGGRLARKDRP
jgi:hypothetical protein